MNIDGLISSAFLDKHGNYAKREEDLQTVRLFFSYDSPGLSEDITPAQFNALTEEQQQEIREAGVSVTVNL